MRIKISPFLSWCNVSETQNRLNLPQKRDEMEWLYDKEIIVDNLVVFCWIG